MANGSFSLSSHTRLEMIDVTAELQKIVREQAIDSGVLYVYNPHTTAGLLINEGADPDVQRDLLGALQKIVPANYLYRHAEGNSPAHLMTAMTGTSVQIFIEQGQLQLGTWQRVFFSEFDGPRSRKLWWKILAG
ncbi:YjbQ family protein [Desulfobulbus rhabdoformis]|uniref:secondary thiamine-phosphate synthase enzyme YjbQ n=1 Tax=Desulfobulbus rhabdoformis TaxID=34032 RepID=UPI001962DDB3|nr:secondary thiamine-phosphate synthase enzyme YjbQ [Desulfobulbus rhabdoformis]MBM9614298.1 YjbQ family protein [Desulfobulbus rhabdoformis]